MLEPLFRCNLACAGCGKIQYPAQILKKHLTVEQCLEAVEECGAPIVSIPGGEPLMYPDIDRLVAELVKRKKYIYLCTNAILLKEKLDLFTPVEVPDASASTWTACARSTTRRCAATASTTRRWRRSGRRSRRGFRVTTNTTLFDGASPLRMREFFDEMMDLGVEGMMLSPGYSYAKAPDQEHFLRQHPHPSALHRDAVEAEAALEVQPVAALPPLPHGQARLRVHAVGQSRPSTCSAGSAPATSSRRATRRPSGS